MAKVETRPWDAAEHIKTKEDVAAYLEAALEDGDPVLIKAVVSDIARSEGIKQVVLGSDLERESLYDAFMNKDSLDFLAVVKLLQALGLRLMAVAA